MDSAGPFEHDVLSDQIQHFEESFIGWENSLALCDLAKLPVVALDHISRVNQLADFGRVLEESGDFSPIALPGLDDQRILRAPDVFKFLQRRQSGLLAGSRVNRLEVHKQLLRVLVGHIADGIADL